jgi:nucleoid DNA-binding protein
LLAILSDLQTIAGIHGATSTSREGIRAMATATKTAKHMTKSEVVLALSEKTELTKKQISSVFEELAALVAKNIGKKGPGVFVVPGLAKIKVIRKPATKARKGINPFTKEETTFKARPARNVVKLQALKAVKDMV